MSDALVQLQDWLAQYPTWMVAGGIGFAVVVVAIVIWKAMRVAITALIVGLVVAAAWYVWDNVAQRGDRRPADALSPAAREAE